MESYLKILSHKMQIPKKIDKVVLLLLSSLLMVIVLFSYLVSIDTSTKKYNIIHDKIVALEIMDTKFDNFALTIDVFKNYNGINKSTTSFKKTLSSLQQNISTQYPKNLELMQSLDDIKKTFATTVDNLEYFKSLNATLINASHFLFDLQQTLRESKNISQQTKSHVNETLFYLLKFTTTDYIDKAFINKQIHNILKLSKKENNKLVYNFYIYSKMMLKTLSELKKLSLEIHNSKLSQELQKLHIFIDNIHNKNLQINRAITLLFFFTSFGLILILLKVYRKSLKTAQKLYAFQFAVKNSDNSIVLTDPQRHITYVNEIFEKMTGYSKEEALGQNPNILKSGKQDENFYIELNKKLDKGEKWEGQFINKRKDGSLYHEKASIVPIVLDNELISYLAITLDITSYIEQNEKLQLAASVFDNTEEAIIITDANNKTISINKAFSKIYGYTLSEIKGKNPRLLNSAMQDTHFFKQMWNSIENEDIWQGKLINKTKYGRYIPVWNTIQVIKDKKGNIIKYIAVQTDLREIENIQKKVDYLAYHDQLTGLYNRANFEEYLEHALSIAKRKKENLSVLFIDLDRFKVINDTLGHDIGDKVLIEIAKRLKHTLRKSDFISRWGGDEFIAILENSLTPEESAKIAKHIIEAVQKPIEVDSHSLTTTASVGIAIYPQDGEDANSLVKHADSALYLAKDTGKNQFQYYTQELSDEVQNKLNVELALRDALKKNEFYLVFQPQYSLQTKEITSLEALIRWNNKDKELTYPDRFIPIAEENGLIVDIGYFVFEESCKALCKMRENGLKIHYIAVNVASVQFKEANLLNIFLSIVEKYNLKASDIEIEITERFIMEPTLDNMSLLRNFRAKGFRISIDDFGTGYSSMAYLKNLPADTIKIDKTFVDDIEKGEAENAIIKAIIALSKTLGYSIVAEGIETKEEESFLAEHKCDYGQGYLFSRPILLEDVIKRFGALS